MIRSICLLCPLLAAANAGGDAPDPANSNEAVARIGRPASSGYLAEVKVSLGGVTQHGRIIVTCDGCVHLEHLDEEARRWACGHLHLATCTANGWDDRPRRAGPVRRVWRRLGENEVLAEVHTRDGSLKISQHKPLSAR